MTSRLPATVVARAADSASLASAFRLAAALRERGLAVQVAGSPPEGGARVEVSGEVFAVTGAAGKTRKLDSVEAVAEALREAAGD